MRRFKTVSGAPQSVGTALERTQAVAVFETGLRLLQNEALQKKSDIEGATRIVEALGLPSHHDFQKNWDTLKCLAHVLLTTPADQPILDAGSGARGVILRWLHAFGYRNLYACDRIEVDQSLFLEPLKIQFKKQDLANTTYTDGQFAAISCISVIEHGVDLDSFFKEMSRILRPQGRLLISTDYWSEPVDCSGIYPYGREHGEMKIFTAKEAVEFVEVAARYQLMPTFAINLETNEKAVRWNRVDRKYTFLFVALEKTATH